MDWDVGDNDHNPSILKKRMVGVIVCSGIRKDHTPPLLKERRAKFTTRDCGENGKCIMQMCLHKWASEDDLTNEKFRHFRNGKHAMLLAL